jgi:phosphatidate cytidylyltransferase
MLNRIFVGLILILILIFLFLNKNVLIVLSIFITSYEYIKYFRHYKYGLIFYLYCLIGHFYTFKNDIYDIIIITQTSDVIQYFIGYFFGKTKNIIKTSPNKSLEGYVGGTMITYLIFNYFNYINIFYYIIGGVLGDLIVSYVKRQINIKDSSTLLKSHGGWLDRIDSILFCSFVNNFYFLIK